MAPLEKKQDLAIYEQPPYETEIAGKTAQVNVALTQQPQYSFLFRTLTPTEEAWHHSKIPIWFGAQWLTMIGKWFGLYNTPVMCGLFSLAWFQWLHFYHDAMHMRKALPKLHAMCSGFVGYTPLMNAYRDASWTHAVRHHHTVKAGLEHNDEWDASWSGVPLWRVVPLMILYPSQFGFFDVLKMWWEGPSAHWPERIATNVCYWLQCLLAHKMGVLKPIAGTSHACSVIGWFLFHACTHRESFYWLMLRDPSGLRYIPVVDEIMHLIIGPARWLECKWHDVHHAFASTMMALSMRGSLEPVPKVVAAMADMVDEGIFLNMDGKPIDHLADAGGALGRRTAWKAAQAKKVQ